MFGIYLSRQLQISYHNTHYTPFLLLLFPTTSLIICPSLPPSLLTLSLFPHSPSHNLIPAYHLSFSLPPLSLIPYPLFSLSFHTNFSLSVHTLFFSPSLSPLSYPLSHSILPLSPFLSPSLSFATHPLSPSLRPLSPTPCCCCLPTPLTLALPTLFISYPLLLLLSTHSLNPC